MAVSQRPETTAVAKKAPAGIRALLEHESARERIAPFLMPGADFDRVVAGAHYAARQNPAILKCTPASIIDAVARIQQWGLEIGVTAHMVPFGDKCNAIADYTGIAELMVASGAVRHVETRAVYERDEFRYRYGLEPELYHVPIADVKTRGPIVAAYCILRLPFGTSTFEVMPAEDIEAIRQRYSKQWKSGPLPAWYARKTLVRQAAKLIPKNRRLAAALRVVHEDEEQEFGQALDAPAPLGALGNGARDEESPATTARSIHNTGVARMVEPQYASDDVPFEDADLFPDDLSDAEIARRDEQEARHRSEH